MAEAVPARDAALLLDMALAAQDALGFVAGLDEAGFLASRLHQNAVIRSLEVVGEAAGKVSPATRASHPEISWREITGMRHRLIHGYADVRVDLVWTVVTGYLPDLLAALDPLIHDGTDLP
ncbi:MAG: DUF86 domain-containing protein [Geminicoccaceae bacterium]|nr:DUF86 domain-containing protein [Geminicoccaceae bacterium]